MRESHYGRIYRNEGPPDTGQIRVAGWQKSALADSKKIAAAAH